MNPNNLPDGGPAYPVADFDHQTFSPSTVDEARRLLSGMSLRDYFAAKAMQAMLTGIHVGANPYLAQQAYQVADAMLAARQECPSC